MLKRGCVAALFVAGACSSSNGSLVDGRVVRIDASPISSDAPVDAAISMVDAPPSSNVPDVAHSSLTIARNAQGAAGLTVTVQDSAGNLVVGVAVFLANSIVTFAPDPSSGVTDSSGLFSSTLTAPLIDNLAIIEPATVTATIGDDLFSLMAKAQFGIVVGTVAGNGTDGYFDGTGGATGTAEFSGPGGLVVDSAGLIYVADTNNCVVRVIDPAGNVTTYAGNQNNCGFADGTIGANGTAEFGSPNGIAIAATGELYLSDGDNCDVREIDTSGNVITLAGNGVCDDADGSGGANGTAEFNRPAGIAVDSAGDVYVADSGNCSVRKIDTSGNVTTVAGNGTCGFADGTGGASGTAEFGQVDGVAVDHAGNVYVADGDNCDVRKIDPSGNVTTLAGNSNCGFSDGTGGSSGTAAFASPNAIAIDANGNLYVDDGGNFSIRVVDPNGNVTTLAGNGTSGFADGTGGISGSSRFKAGRESPAFREGGAGVALDGSGNLYVADPNNADIRVITSPLRSSTMSASPSEIDADGVSATAITLMLVDTAGNPVVGQSVVVNSNLSGTTLTPPNGVTDSNGVFTSMLSSTNSGRATISAAGQSVDVTLLPWKVVAALDGTTLYEGERWQGSIGGVIYIAASNGAQEITYDTSSGAFGTMAAPSLCACGGNEWLASVANTLIAFTNGGNGEGTPSQYDAVNDQWNVVGSALNSLGGSSANVVALNDVVYFVGGNSSNAVVSFTPSTAQWATLANYPYVVSSPQLAAFGGKIYGFGGANDGSQPVAAYDPSLDQWTELSTAPVTFANGSYGDEYAQPFGDNIFSLGADDQGQLSLAVYDPSTDAWATETVPLPANFDGDPALMPVNGNLYFLANATDTATDTLTVWQYVPPSAN